MAAEKVLTISPYTLLSRWFFDGSSTTEVPKDAVKAISQLYLLMYFQASPLICYISKHFNNYGLFSLPKEEVFQFMKLIISKTGYKAPFIKSEKIAESGLIKCLKKQYTDLKPSEIGMIVDFINSSDEKDAIYEMFGLYKPKNKKLTAAEKKRLKNVEAEKPKPKEEAQSLSFEDLLNI